MSRTTDPSRDLLFGLLALQNGLIDQGALFAAFATWTRDKARSLADHLIDLGHLDAPRRAVVEAIAGLHVQALGGDPGKSLAALSIGPSICQKLAQAGGPDVEASLGQVGSGHRSTQNDDEDPERTGAYSVGSATSDGQRFRILRHHAKGGLGAVFVALDSELNREVALKQILEKYADDPVSRQRFVAEAEITGGLEHPGVVPVYGLGTDAGGRPYYAMRFIKGDSLKEAIDRFHKDEALQKDPGRRSLELRKLLHRFTDVCNAIDYAHSRGVIHRDLKPANIIVGKHGETLVVDWGLAKAVGRADPSVGEQTIAPSSGGSSETLPGSALGTPAYMSPEQARGDLNRLGPRSDVYGLGATLYCLLTGKPPFENDEIGVILRAVQEGQFPRPSQCDPSLDKALEAVCLKAMATGPADRYPTPRALADDLESWMADEPVIAWREPFSRRARRWARRNRTAVTAAGAAVLVALVGTAAVLGVQTRANASLHAANTELGIANANATRANTELAAANGRERARFALAQEAIRMFHTGVSDDLLLRQKEFGALRTKLLRGAQEFYRKLEGLLGDHTDRDSRLALGRAYYEVGELTRQLDSLKDALAMHQRALALFEELTRKAPADAVLRSEVERSCAAIAGLLSSLGQKADALAATARARAIAQDLAASDPADIERRRELARVDHLHAVFLFDNSRVTEGLDALERARASQEDLIRSSPTDERCRLDLAKTCDDLAIQLASSGRKDEALAVYGRARELAEGLFLAKPADARIAHELVRTLGNMALSLEGAGRQNEALAAYGRAREVLATMEESNPTLLAITRDRAWIDTITADVLMRTARDAEALPMLESARKARERLVNVDPTVVRDQEQLVMINYRIAEIHTRAGRTSEALESYKRAVAVARQAADANPRNWSFYSQLAGALGAVAEFSVATGKPSEALPWSGEALAIVRRTVEAEPSEQAHRWPLAVRLGRHGIVLQSCGRPAEAVSAFREAIAILEGIAEPNYVVVYRIACIQSLLCGVASDVGSGLTAKSGRAEADKAMETLRRAVAAGFRNTTHLRVDSDLDPIRSRPDFQLLELRMMDVEFPIEPFAPAR